MLDKIHDTVEFFNCDFFLVMQTVFILLCLVIGLFFYTVCNLKLPQETIFLVLKLCDFLRIQCAETLFGEVANQVCYFELI